GLRGLRPPIAPCTPSADSDLRSPLRASWTGGSEACGLQLPPVPQARTATSGRRSAHPGQGAQRPAASNCPLYPKRGQRPPVAAPRILDRGLRGLRPPIAPCTPSADSDLRSPLRARMHRMVLDGASGVRRTIGITTDLIIEERAS